MDVDRMRESPIGHVVPIAGHDQRRGEQYEHWAYIPEPLPSSVPLEPATWTAVARAEASLARLDEAARQVPETAIQLRRVALRREAQSTSALEGTFAPFEDVLEPDVEERGHLSAEMREILNYVVAAEQGFEWIADRPLTAAVIGQLQRTLVHGTASEHSDSGGVRDRQVVVGPREAPIAEARFVPPPPGDQLRSDFGLWVDWVNSPADQLPPVVCAALAHYQFETLHPFSDGNGRIGRLLIVLQLMLLGTLREPILVVSPWFEARRREYQDGLLQLSRSGGWDDWVAFFVEGVAAAADATKRRLDSLIGWRQSALEATRSAGVSGVAERLAGELIGTPILTASRVSAAHGITHQGAMNALRRLADLDLLEERRRAGRRVFASNDVIAMLRL